MTLCLGRFALCSWVRSAQSGVVQVAVLPAVEVLNEDTGVQVSVMSLVSALRYPCIILQPDHSARNFLACPSMLALLSALYHQQLHAPHILPGPTDVIAEHKHSKYHSSPWASTSSAYLMQMRFSTGATVTEGCSLN